MEICSKRKGYLAIGEASNTSSHPELAVPHNICITNRMVSELHLFLEDKTVTARRKNIRHQIRILLLWNAPKPRGIRIPSRHSY